MATTTMRMSSRILSRVVGHKTRHKWCLQKGKFHCCSAHFAPDESPGKGFRIPQTQQKTLQKAEKISLAMKEYLEKAQSHEKMKKEVTQEYEVGRRHLANIMGMDSDSFTQEDIKKAVSYLLPSGLFDKRATPMFLHPDEIIMKNKVVAISEDGRPLHFLFYTRKPNFFELMHNVSGKIEKLKEEDFKTPVGQMSQRTLDLSTSEWITLKEFADFFPGENVADKEYQQFIKIMEKLTSLRFARKERTFIMKYRTSMETKMQLTIPEAQVDDEGRFYMKTSGRRKTATAEVTLYSNGSGIIHINGQGIDYFKDMTPREQLLFPLSLTDMVGHVDIYATTSGGGPVSQSGAIRYAISNALLPFVSNEMANKMKIAGLLSKDIRTRERKKPGQKKARKKFTWKAR